MKSTAKIFIEDKETAWEKADEGVRRKIMAYNPELMMVKVEFEKGAVGNLHSHPHTQISYVESGIFEVEIGGDKKILRTGDTFSIPSNIIHGVVCRETGSLIDIFNPMREDFLK